MPLTSNAACTLLFALRTVGSNATTTPKWPNDLSTQGSDWRGRPSSKRTSRSLDVNRRDSSGGTSSPLGISSLEEVERNRQGAPQVRHLHGRQRRHTGLRRQNPEGPYACGPFSYRRCVRRSSHQLSCSEPAPDDLARPLSSTTAHARQATVAAITA